MDTSGTVIFAAPKQELAMALASSMPGLRVVTIGSEVPQARLGKPVWCFIDWLLPETSGLEMCRRLRSSPATADSHITLAIEENDLESRRRALKAGADDYLIGPMTESALLARLSVPFVSGDATESLSPKSSGINIDMAAHQARWQGKPIALGLNEFHLLIHFVEKSGQVLTRTQLIELQGKNCEAIDERTVDVWVGRLRRALRKQGMPDPIRTVRSMGYVFDEIDPGPHFPVVTS
jgi:two-component system, OmpR family, phosphate regulon response regulator PhoB